MHGSLCHNDRDTFDTGFEMQLTLTKRNLSLHVLIDID